MRIAVQTRGVFLTKHENGQGNKADQEICLSNYEKQELSYSVSEADCSFITYFADVLSTWANRQNIF